MNERHASDISNVLTQDAVADSLLGEDVPQQQEETESQYAASGADLLDEAITEQVSERLQFDEGDAAWREKYGQPEEAQAEQPPERLRSERQEAEQPEQPEQQAAELTPQEIDAGIQRLESAVQQYGLNDEASRRELAAGFCESLGTNPDAAGVNVEAFGNVSAKTMLSTLQIYDAVGGDLSKLPAIPEQSAKVWVHDVLTSFGVDPRTVPTDASYLARTVQGALFSVLSAYQNIGTEDVRRINSPEAAEFYYGHFVKALAGIDPPANKTPEYRAAALKFADTWAKYAIGFVGKVRQVNEQRAASQQRQPRARGPRVPAQFREGIRGSKAPRFSSNQDIFDAPTMDFYNQQHGRL